MAEVFYSGATELATLSNTFLVNNTPTDPDAVTLVVTDPTGEQTTYDNEIDNPDVGEYTIDIACTVAGVWSYVWVGTGVGSDVAAGTWTVFDTTLNRLYCTPEELKSAKGIDDTLDDFEIIGACTAVSRWIDEHCGRPDTGFVRFAGTRTFIPSCGTELDCGDLVSITTLKTDDDDDGVFETTWSTTDYELLPHDAVQGIVLKPYHTIRAVANRAFPIPYSGRSARVQIVGVFGWPAVPDAVKIAAKILAGDYTKLGSMAFGVQGYGEYGPVRARQSTPAIDMLHPYRTAEAVFQVA